MADQRLEEARPGSRFGLGDDQHEIGEEELGCGAAARVYSCKKLRTGEQLAVKIINLQRLQLLGDIDSYMDKLDREVRILRDLRHSRIVTLHYVHRTENWYYVVMERIRGGELFNQIVENKSLSEVESRYVFRQLLEGIGYMHAKRIIHRDLKPENILITGSSAAPPPAAGVLHDVKIADFGLAKVLSEGMSFASTFVGTPQYSAPEVIKIQSQGGTYNQAVDYWGLGVILFVMLSGRYPFDGKKRPIEEQIKSGSYKMDTTRWKGISEDAKNVIRGLLQVEPDERLRLEACARHPWVSEGAGCTSPLVLPLLPQRLSSPALKPGHPARADLPRDPFSELLQAEEPPLLFESCEAHLVPAAEEGAGKEELASRTVSGSGKDECESRTLSGSPSVVAESRASSGQSCTSAVECIDDQELKNNGVAAVRRLGKRWLAFASSHCPRRHRRFLRNLAAFLTIMLCLTLLQRMTYSWLDDQEADPTSGHAPLELLRRGYKGTDFGPGLAQPEEPRSMDVVPTSASDEPTRADQCKSQSPQERIPPGLAQEIAHNIARSMAQSMAQSAHGAVPLLPQLGDDVLSSSPDTMENQTFFSLTDLLKLQVTIIGSLEMARLAFRHADPELSELTRQTSRMAKEVSQLAANVVAQYAHVAQHVSQFVLPDLKLAVQADEPKLAASLMDMVKSWVAAMKTDGEDMRDRYSELQAAVLNLVRRAQNTKSGADRRLAEAAQVVEIETSEAASPSQPIQPGFSADIDQPRESTHAKSSSTSLEEVSGTILLDSWMGQLFEKLTELSARSSQGTDHMEKGNAPSNGEHTSFGMDDLDVAWKRDLIDLLFLAPGAVPSSLSKIESGQSASRIKDREGSFSVASDVFAEDENNTDTGHWKDRSPRSQARNPVVASVRNEAQFASHSSAALLRALQELKRVDGILQGCSAFWANMHGTVQTLAQMKDHTEFLVKFAAGNPQVKDRFNQRLEEYRNFWASLWRLSRQYCADHQAASARMQEFIHEMTDAADIIDTAESATTGVMAGRRDRQANQSLP